MCRSLRFTKVIKKLAVAAVFSQMRSVSVPLGMSDPDHPNISTTLWRTVADHGGMDYLQRGFFHALREELPHRVRFARAHRNGDTIAGALFFQTEQGLYGRYWGCDEDHDCLHFETAYYAGIEYAIQQGIPLFEAGAQGEHKLLRGFEPSRTYSNHWIRHAGLFRGVRQFLAEEARAIEHRIETLAGYGPYRQEEG